MFKRKFLSVAMISMYLACISNLNSYSKNDRAFLGAENRVKYNKKIRNFVGANNFSPRFDRDKYADDEINIDNETNADLADSGDSPEIQVSSPLGEDFRFNNHMRGASGKKLREGSHMDFFSRSKYVKRWHNLKSSEEYTLAEHLFNTAMITLDLVLFRKALIDSNEIQGDPAIDKDLDAYIAVFIGLIHDWPEIYTGDVLATTKYCNLDVKTAYSKVENSLKSEFLNLVPQRLKKYYIKLLNPTPYIKKMVKAADTIENYITSLKECSRRNFDFVEPCRILKSQILKIAESLPEVKCYCEEVLHLYDSGAA